MDRHAAWANGLKCSKATSRMPISGVAGPPSFLPHLHIGWPLRVASQAQTGWPLVVASCNLPPVMLTVTRLPGAQGSGMVLPSQPWELPTR